MPHIMGGNTVTNFSLDGSGDLNTYWTPNSQLQWESQPGGYSALDDMLGTSIPYLENPTLATDAFWTPLGLRGSRQMQQILAL